MYNREAPDVRMRNWIEQTRKVAGRLPKRYATLEEAYERMQEANAHLSAEQARHLTIHGANQNEDGTYSWKFDNYTHVMSPFDMTQEQSRELWRRIEAPILLVSGKESWFRHGDREDPAQFFQNAKHVVMDKAGHWVHHDRLDEFLQLTREFFGNANG